MKKEKLSDVTNFVMEGIAGGDNFSMPESVAASAQAVGKYFARCGLSLDGKKVLAPISGPNKASHFYIEDDLALIVVWQNDVPSIWQRA